MKITISILLLLFYSTVFAQDIKSCDSLIGIGVKQLGKNDHISSLENLNKAYVIASQNRWYNEQFLALNNIGANYYALLNYGEALHYYLEAYQLAISHLDKKREMIVLNNIAILYLSDKEFKKAAEYGERAYEIAKEAGNAKRIVLYGVNLGLIYNKIGDLQTAAKYFSKVENIGFPDSHINLINAIGKTENAYLSGKYAQAIQLANSLLVDSENRMQQEERCHLNLLLSKIHLKQGGYEDAVQFCTIALDASFDLETKIEGYQQLATLYREEKKYDRVVALHDTLFKLKDSLYQVKNGKYFESNKLSFEIKKYQQDAANSLLTLKQERQLHYTLLGSSGIVILILVWGFKNSYLKNRHKKESAEQEREIALLELKRRENEKLIMEKQMLEKEAQQKLEKAELRHQIETKNRKLSAKALYMTERNEILKNTIEIINSQGHLNGNTIIKKELKKLKEFVKNDGSWDDFAKHFEDVNQGYLEKLKSSHPSLNGNDLRFVSYLYMNLSQKEISTILSISPDACRKRKERISKKIGLTDGSELYDFLYSV